MFNIFDLLIHLDVNLPLASAWAFKNFINADKIFKVHPSCARVPIFYKLGKGVLRSQAWSWNIHIFVSNPISKIPKQYHSSEKHWDLYTTDIKYWFTDKTNIILHESWGWHLGICWENHSSTVKIIWYQIRKICCSCM